MKLVHLVALWVALAARAADPASRPPLDPRGQIHIPIGIPDTLDSVKTFVEAEGSFSPGFGSYGVYFWVWDAQQKKLFAPTMDGVPCEHGLAEGGLLIPWSKWSAGRIAVRTEVCEVQRPADSNLLCVVGARVHLTWASWSDHSRLLMTNALSIFQSFKSGYGSIFGIKN